MGCCRGDGNLPSSRWAGKALKRRRGRERSPCWPLCARSLRGPVSTFKVPTASLPSRRAPFSLHRGQVPASQKCSLAHFRLSLFPGTSCVCVGVGELCGDSEGPMPEGTRGRGAQTRDSPHVRSEVESPRRNTPQRAREQGGDRAAPRSWLFRGRVAASGLRGSVLDSPGPRRGPGARPRAWARPLRAAGRGESAAANRRVRRRRRRRRPRESAGGAEAAAGPGDAQAGGPGPTGVAGARPGPPA